MKYLISALFLICISCTKVDATIETYKKRTEGNADRRNKACQAGCYPNTGKIDFINYTEITFVCTCDESYKQFAVF